MTTLSLKAEKIHNELSIKNVIICLCQPNIIF